MYLFNHHPEQEIMHYVIQDTPHASFQTKPPEI